MAREVTKEQFVEGDGLDLDGTQSEFSMIRTVRVQTWMISDLS